MPKWSEFWLEGEVQNIVTNNGQNVAKSKKTYFDSSSASSSVVVTTSRSRPLSSETLQDSDLELEIGLCDEVDSEGLLSYVILYTPCN